MTLIGKVNSLKKIKQQRQRARQKPLEQSRSVWKPIPNSPQEKAFHSPADELFYGGAGGSGKTDLLLGIAGNQARHSIIFRRVFPSVRSIIERSRDMYNAQGATHSRDSYNESLHIWRLADDRTVEFGSIQYEKDKEKYRGRPHDFYGWDELTEFPESVFRFVNTWNRTADQSLRCRIVGASNPPTTPEGLWVIDYWAPFLNPEHPQPAKPGDLVWVVRLDDRDVEIGRTLAEDASIHTPRPTIEHNGRIITARSRSFIPGRVEDNPYLMATGYDTMLDSLPEPLRSQMRFGVFGLRLDDDAFQIIPSAWVDAAMARWTPDPPCQVDAIGCDPARGGRDRSAIAIRCGDWFNVQGYPGAETPDGASVAQLILTHLHPGESPAINIDVIGVGASPVDVLHQMGLMAIAINGARGSDKTDKTGKMGFANQRAEQWWHMRELLDPDYGLAIALPPDRELKAELCSARWQLRGWKIAVESKDLIKDRIGRSPDKAEAVIYAAIPIGFGAVISGATQPRSSHSAIKNLY